MTARLLSSRFGLNYEIAWRNLSRMSAMAADMENMTIASHEAISSSRELLARLAKPVAKPIAMSRDAVTCNSGRQGSTAELISTLTPREQQIMAYVVAGKPNKVIASELGVSQRTVEHHRQAFMRKMGAKSLASLVRMVLTQGSTP